jgi:hypothetical protein
MSVRVSVKDLVCDSVFWCGEVCEYVQVCANECVNECEMLFDAGV